jgi:hypothetical protein
MRLMIDSSIIVLVALDTVLGLTGAISRAWREAYRKADFTPRHPLTMPVHCWVSSISCGGMMKWGCVQAKRAWTFP